MSLDNRDAIEPLTQAVEEDGDAFAALTDRELLLSIARDIAAVRAVAEQAVTQIEPLMKSPMFAMLGKFAR